MSISLNNSRVHTFWTHTKLYKSCHENQTENNNNNNGMERDALTNNL